LFAQPVRARAPKITSNVKTARMAFLPRVKGFGRFRTLLFLSLFYHKEEMIVCENCSSSYKVHKVTNRSDLINLTNLTNFINLHRA